MKKSNISAITALVFNSAFSGAFLFIAIVIVPFWASLEPKAINEWYSTYFWRFPTVMVPLNLLTFIFIAVGTFRAHKQNSTTKTLWYAGLVAIFLCSLTYPLIFDGANKVMMASNADLGEVADSFEKWSNWHRVRNLLSFISLGILIAINRKSADEI